MFAEIPIVGGFELLVICLLLLIISIAFRREAQNQATPVRIFARIFQYFAVLCVIWCLICTAFAVLKRF